MQSDKLRESILQDPVRAFREIGLALFPIAADLFGDQEPASRVDILALNPHGQGVILVVAGAEEGDTGQTTLSRAVAGARRVAGWSSEDLFRLLNDNEAEKLGLFLEVDVDDINATRSIIVVSAGFNKQTLSTADWLREHWGLKITCLDVVIAADPETQAPYFLSTEVS